MHWNPIILGIVDDVYSNNFWILFVISIAGSLLCYYRYKSGLIVIPIVSVVCVIFLAGFLEPQNYIHIQSLTHSMPRIIASIIVLFILPFIGAFFGWRKSKSQRSNLP